MSRLSLTGQPRHFFPGKNPDLGAGSAGLRRRAGGALGIEASTSGWHGSAGLESISGAYAFEAAGWEAPMPGRWCGRGGFYAGQVGFHETMILHAVLGTSHL